MIDPNNLNEFFEPVQVFPSARQIEYATRILPYSEIQNPINESCPISLERFQPNDNVLRILYCGHIYRIDSINNWFRSNCRCPVCRYDIRQFNGDTLNNNNNNNNNTPTRNLIQRDISNNLLSLVDGSFNIRLPLYIFDASFNNTR